MARILRISEEMVRRHTRAGRFQRTEKKEYDVEQVVQAYIDVIENKEGDKSLTDERTRLTRYQADRAYLELQEKRHELWPVRICMMFFSEVVKSAQNELLALKNNIKMDYPDIDDNLLIYIDKRIREALERASEANTPHGLSNAVESWTRGDVETPTDIEGE